MPSKVFRSPKIMPSGRGMLTLVRKIDLPKGHISHVGGSRMATFYTTMHMLVTSRGEFL